MSAHTPGPWVCEPPEDGGRVIACDARETIIHIPPCSPYNPTSAADARLIAAAPELLAACADALALLRTLPDEYAMPDHPVFGNLRAAIAKAEGR